MSESRSPVLAAPKSTLKKVPSALMRKEMPPVWTTGLAKRALIYFSVTVVFTLVFVNYSLRHGRLAVGPTDDDCIYLVDGLQRLSLLQQSPRALFESLVRYPPHSPFSSGLAMIAFAIFGSHQWAP